MTLHEVADFEDLWAWLEMAIAPVLAHPQGERQKVRTMNHVPAAFPANAFTPFSIENEVRLLGMLLDALWTRPFILYVVVLR